MQAGGNYTLTTAVAITQDGTGTGGRITIEGYTTTPGARDGRPTITCATNSVNLFELNAANYITFRHLKMTHTAGTRGAALAGVTANSAFIWVDDCEVDGCSYVVSAGSRNFQPLIFTNNKVINCTTGGIVNAMPPAAGTFGDLVEACYFKSNTGACYDTGGSSSGAIFRRNIFASNGRGFYDTGTSRTQVFAFIQNTFANNTNDGIRIDETTGSVALWLEGNIFYGNGAYGINIQDGQTENDTRVICNRNNAYGTNTSGDRLNLGTGTGDVSITGDPFTNAAGGDYSLDASGLTDCKALGFPGVFPGSTTTGYLDIGAAQHQDSGSVASPVGHQCM